MNPIFLVLLIGGLIAAKMASSGEFSSISSGSSPDPFTRFDPLFHKYSLEFNVPWRWLKAIAMNESNLGQASSVAEGLSNPQDVDGSKSSDGLSWGLMQTTLGTARQFESAITPVGLNDPDISVRIAAKYLQWVMENYFSDEEDVIRAYNGGPGFSRGSTDQYFARYQSNMGRLLNAQPGDRSEVG